MELPKPPTRHEAALCAYLGFLNKVLSYTKIACTRFRINTDFFMDFLGFVLLLRGMKDLSIHHF
jgi:hypothetical protein